LSVKPRKATPRKAKPAAPAPRRRDRAATEEGILAAVGEVLARDGFGGIGVNAIARQCGIDKVLIYRYFGGLSELLRLWGSSGRFWPTVDELLGPEPQPILSLPAAERYAAVFERFIDALRARPLTIEILAAEIVERNDLTAILETEREQWGAQVEARFGGEDFRRRPHLRGVTLLMVAGVQHLLVRSRTIRAFGGADLANDAGWNLLKSSLRATAHELFIPEAPSDTRSSVSRVPRAVRRKPVDPRVAAEADKSPVAPLSRKRAIRS
jgi:AcrR family transcriptional regulator